jgi:hypothetical protein
MSELAAGYYRQRAGDIGVAALPPLLRDGTAVTLLTLPGPVVSSGQLRERYCEEVAPLAAIALEGVPLALHARSGKSPTTSQWSVMKQRLKPWGRFATLEQFANRNVARAVLRVLPLRGGIYLDALAREEVPEAALRRTTKNTGYYTPRPEEESQEPAQVYLMTRSITADGTCVRAHLSVAWGHFGRPNHNSDQLYLGVRYLGAPLLEQEIGALPPLVMPESLPPQAPAPEG